MCGSIISRICYILTAYYINISIILTLRLMLAEELKLVKDTESEVKATQPEFKAVMRDATITIGQPVTFQCHVVGHPRPDVHWTKVGIEDFIS